MSQFMPALMCDVGAVIAKEDLDPAPGVSIVALLSGPCKTSGIDRQRCRQCRRQADLIKRVAGYGKPLIN
jgi:hypothetical protein